MPAVAKKDGASQVAATDGNQGNLCGTFPTRYNWDAATTQVSAAGSADVFVEDIGIVRKDDVMVSHPDGAPCVVSAQNHAPALSTYSSNVFANDLEIGRVTDKYNKSTSFDHTITTGAGSVFANS